MSSRTTASVPVASRISGFNYAIRNIVAEARKVEAAGRTVRYLNIGDPITFGFRTPPHLVEAVERAIRDGHNGYAPSVGIGPAREAVAAECQRRGMPLDPDRVVITAGTSEGIELALTALAGPGDEVLVPVPTYPLYTAVLAKIGARPVFYSTTPGTPLAARRGRDSAADRTGDARAGGHRSEQPHGQHLSGGGQARAVADCRRAQHPAARRRGLRRPRLRRSGGRDREARSRCTGDHLLVAVEGLPRARMAFGMARRRPQRADGRRARRDQEARRRPVVQHGADGVRDRRGAERRPLAPGVSPGACASAPT